MAEGSTAQRLVSDEVWELVEPFIPQPRRRRRGAMVWLLSFRRLALRHDRSRDTIEALLSLASALIFARRLPAAS